MLPISLLSLHSHPGSPTQKNTGKVPQALAADPGLALVCVIPIVPLLHLNYDSFPPSQAFLLALPPVPPVATSGSQSALLSWGRAQKQESSLRFILTHPLL